MTKPLAAYSKYKLVEVVDLGNFVYSVRLNRPKQLNALNNDIWFEIGDVFVQLDEDVDCRAVVLSGNGRAFTTGLDLSAFSSTLSLEGDDDVARKARKILRIIHKMQGSFTAIEKCCKPVVAAIHGYCLGGGIDIITACDVRFSTRDAEYSVKEAAVGLAADVGSLNRLPKIIGNHSWLRDVALTARHFRGEEAAHYGLVSRLFDTREELEKEALVTASAMAMLSPVAVQGTKVVLNYARDHPVDESLKFVAIWNASQLQSDDVPASAMAVMSKGKSPAHFSKL